MSFSPKVGQRGILFNRRDLGAFKLYDEVEGGPPDALRCRGARLGDVTPVAPGRQTGGAMVLKRRRRGRTQKLEVMYGNRPVYVGGKRLLDLVALRGRLETLEWRDTEGSIC